MIPRGPLWLVANAASDGTVNALATGLEGWDGALLVLPGGTANLLTRAIQGERGAGGGVGQRIEPTADHRSVPSGDRIERKADRLRGRVADEGLAA